MYVGETKRDYVPVNARVEVEGLKQTASKVEHGGYVVLLRMYSSADADTGHWPRCGVLIVQDQQAFAAGVVQEQALRPVVGECISCRYILCQWIVTV